MVKSAAAELPDIRNHQRNAVHQQYQVRHYERLATVVTGRAVHAVLVHSGKAVVGGFTPVDKANGLSTPNVPTVQPVLRKPLE